MKFREIQEEVSKYVYSEDDGMVRIALASILSTKLKLGDPVWMLLIGPSSGGKSQVLRPLALTDKKFIHRVDDLTENTLLSGMKVKKGEKDISLLNRIGKHGIIVISDFTVIFSKSQESRASILGQLRMVYDGEMTKFSGTSSEPIKWEGSLGILAGSTPSIYTHFEEVADMGERFIYYRMKPYDVEKATRISLGRKVYGKELDEKLSEIYADYLKECAVGAGDNVPNISIEVYERIIQIALLAAKLRTPTHYDRFAKAIDKVPVSEAPMRVALQLCAIAKGLSVMQYNEDGEWDLKEEDISHIEWCAYSLANEERRACLKVVASVDFGETVKGQTVADIIGLNTSVIGMNLQHLAAIGVLERTGDSTGLNWSIKDKNVWSIVRRLEGIKDNMIKEIEREISDEEVEQKEEISELDFANF